MIDYIQSNIITLIFYLYYLTSFLLILMIIYYRKNLNLILFVFQNLMQSNIEKIKEQIICFFIIKSYQVFINLFLIF